MRRFGWIGVVAAELLAPVALRAADLQDAFKAALGQVPPMIRHANLPNWGETDLHLEPLLLIHVSGSRFALIISESFNGAHAAAGDVAVAYLDQDPTKWHPIRVWYEFIQTGSFGTPFLRQQARSFDFGVSPFFAGESEYCGMGACTRWYNLIGLNVNGPVDWGSVPASGSFNPPWLGDPNPLPDGAGLTGCGGYEYSSVISAPRMKGDAMQLAYTGWMVPGGKAQARRQFRVTAEVSVNGRPTLRPDVKMPNCGS